MCMTMEWFECATVPVSSHKLVELGFPEERLTRHGGRHRWWRRAGHGSSRTGATKSEQTLTLYVALAGDPAGERWGCLALWEMTTATEDGCYTWRSATIGPLGEWRDRMQDIDMDAVIAAMGPFSPEIPSGCPVWQWTAADVAEYRGLASEQSARR